VEVYPPSFKGVSRIRRALGCGLVEFQALEEMIRQMEGQK